MTVCTWTIGWVSAQLCEQLSKGHSTGARWTRETLRKSLDFWWPHVRRDVLLQAKTCKECTDAGEKFKRNK